MTYLYVLIGGLAFLAARSIIDVRRLAKAYADGISRDHATKNTNNHEHQP